MEIIAKLKEGYLIQATKTEISEILNAVSGKRPEKLEIGQKIPAIDYASTILKVNTLKDDFSYKNMVSKCEDFIREVREIDTVIKEASNIEI